MEVSSGKVMHSRRIIFVVPKRKVFGSGWVSLHSVLLSTVPYRWHTQCKYKFNTGWKLSCCTKMDFFTKIYFVLTLINLPFTTVWVWGFCLKIFYSHNFLCTVVWRVRKVYLFSNSWIIGFSTPTCLEFSYLFSGSWIVD